MERISEHIYVNVDHAGCTVGAIATDAGTVLIDSPKQPTRAAIWRADLGELPPVRYLINTEHHVDHVFGNAFMPGRIISSTRTKAGFWDDSSIGPNPMRNPAKYVARVDPEGVALVATYDAREPEITFDASLRLWMGDLTIDAFVRPGHTDAETAVYVPQDKVLFTSDQVFNEAMIWYDESLPFAWLDTLVELRSLDIDVVVPGHGRPGGPELLDQMHDSVSSAIAQVRVAIDSGMEREEIIDRVTLPDLRLISNDHRAFGEQLQQVFVARIFDQIAALDGASEL